jgi:hypothetical protein
MAGKNNRGRRVLMPQAWSSDDVLLVEVEVTVYLSGAESLEEVDVLGEAPVTEELTCTRRRRRPVGRRALRRPTSTLPRRAEVVGIVDQ